MRDNPFFECNDRRISRLHKIAIINRLSSSQFVYDFKSPSHGRFFQAKATKVGMRLARGNVDGHGWMVEKPILDRLDHFQFKWAGNYDPIVGKWN